MSRDPHFHESRALGPRFGWSALVVGAVLAAALFAVRDGPTSPAVLGATTTAVLSAVFWTVRITTAVGPEEVSVRVRPLGAFSQRIPLDDVERYEVVGTTGAVRLERTDGRSTVLRTARPDEFVRALERAMDGERLT